METEGKIPVMNRESRDIGEVGSRRGGRNKVKRKKNMQTKEKTKNEMEKEI